MIPSRQVLNFVGLNIKVEIDATDVRSQYVVVSFMVDLRDGLDGRRSADGNVARFEVEVQRPQRLFAPLLQGPRSFFDNFVVIPSYLMYSCLVLEQFSVLLNGLRK